MLGLGHVVGTAAEMLRFGPQRFRRHAWASDGHGRIEVKSGTDGALGSAVAEALGRLQGVRWAQINAVTGHALVSFDEHQVNMATLVETVTAIEETGGAHGNGWSRAEPPHPDDPAAVTAAVIGLVADVTGLLAACANRLFLVPPVPGAARVAVGIIEAQPRLRRALERGLGPAGTDLVVGVGSGVLNGLTGGIGPQLVTGLSHGLLLREVRSRRAVWRVRATDLEDAPGALPQHPPLKWPRPTPFPPGPIERFADRIAAGSLTAAAVLFATTRDVSRTANLLLIGVPPAARLGREAFAADLARRLAEAGVIPMDPGVYRRLDRITAILVDPHLPTELVELESDPLSAADFTAEAIRKLQADGHAVMAIAAGDNDVLTAADVAVAIPVAGQPIGWTADLITTADPATALTLARAVPAARRLTRRAVTVAFLGSAAAGIATAVLPGIAGDLAMQPVYLSGLVTQLDGVITAALVSREESAALG